MNRDGAAKSIWQNEFEAYEPQNKFDTSKRYDALIIGGGITGLTTALIMQEKGFNCILAEAHNIAFGTSGGTTAHLNTLMDTPYYTIEQNFSKEAARQVAIGAREAIDLVEGLAAKYNIACDFSYKTAFLFSQSEQETEELQKIMDANNAVSVLTNVSNAIPVPIPYEKAISIEFQAQIHPTKYLLGLARAFEQLGGTIVQHCMVDGVAEEGEEVIADTATGQIKAGVAIYATHIPPGVNIFSFRCAPYRSYAIAVTLNDNNYPDALVYDMQDPYHYYRMHIINGTKYLIAGGFDHKTGHNYKTEHIFTELEAYVRKYFDVASVEHKWSSQYYEPVDGLPYIGLMPGNERIYTATGFGGNGMIYGSLAAKTLCSIIHGEPTPYEDLFDPGRIKIVAGFSNFLKENLDVIGQFVSKRFSYEEMSHLVELAPGTAIVTNVNNHKIAIYKDEQSHIYALDATCPHAKCIVGWNSAEKTWDCPCHGARFAPNGDLLNGPAQKGLTPVEWDVISGIV